jgi:hypothetical protein
LYCVAGGIFAAMWFVAAIHYVRTYFLNTQQQSQHDRPPVLDETLMIPSEPPTNDVPIVVEGRLRASTQEEDRGASKDANDAKAPRPTKSYAMRRTQSNKNPEEEVTTLAAVPSDGQSAEDAADVQIPNRNRPSYLARKRDQSPRPGTGEAEKTEDTPPRRSQSSSKKYPPRASPSPAPQVE